MLSHTPPLSENVTKDQTQIRFAEAPVELGKPAELEIRSLEILSRVLVYGLSFELDFITSDQNKNHREAYVGHLELIIPV